MHSPYHFPLLLQWEVIFFQEDEPCFVVAGVGEVRSGEYIKNRLMNFQIRTDLGKFEANLGLSFNGRM